MSRFISRLSPKKNILFEEITRAQKNLYEEYAVNAYYKFLNNIYFQ